MTLQDLRFKPSNESAVMDLPRNFTGSCFCSLAFIVLFRIRTEETLGKKAHTIKANRNLTMNMPKTTASTLASEEGDDPHDLPDSKRLRPTESTSSSGSNSNSNSREESSSKKSRDHASVNYLSSQEPIATSGDQVQQFANLPRQNTALRGTSTTFQPLAPNLEIILKEADPEQPIQDPSSGSPSSGLQINPPRGNLRRRDVGSPSNALRSLLVDRRRTRTSPPSDDSASPPTVAAASFAHQHQAVSTAATTKPPQTIRWYHTALLIGHSTYIDGLILEQHKQLRDQQQSNYSIAFPDVDEELWDLAMSFSFQAQRQFQSRSSSCSTKDETKESKPLENQPFTNTRAAVDDTGYTAATSHTGRAPMAFPELVRPAPASSSSLVSMIMSGTKGDTQHSCAPKEEEEDPEVMNVHQALRLALFYDKYGFVRAKQICDKVIASHLAKFQEICQRQQAYEWEQHDHLKKQLVPSSSSSTPSPQQDQMTSPSTTSPIRRMLTRDHPTTRTTDHIGERHPSSASPTIIFSTDTISSLVDCSRVANLPIAQEQARSLLKQVFFHWQDFHQGHVGMSHESRECLFPKKDLFLFL